METVINACKSVLRRNPMTNKNNNKIKHDNKKPKPEPVGQVKDVTKTSKGIFELDRKKPNAWVS